MGGTDTVRVLKPHGNLVLYKPPKFIFIYIREFHWSYPIQGINNVCPRCIAWQIKPSPSGVGYPPWSCWSDPLEQNKLLPQPLLTHQNLMDRSLHWNHHSELCHSTQRNQVGADSKASSLLANFRSTTRCNHYKLLEKKVSFRSPFPCWNFPQSPIPRTTVGNWMGEELRNLNRQRDLGHRVQCPLTLFPALTLQAHITSFFLAV